MRFDSNEKLATELQEELRNSDTQRKNFEQHVQLLQAEIGQAKEYNESAITELSQQLEDEKTQNEELRRNLNSLSSTVHASIHENISIVTQVATEKKNCIPITLFYSKICISIMYVFIP